MAQNVHIARNGEELGVLKVADALELLREGFLQDTDEFWTTDCSQRRPLGQLSADVERDGRSLAKRARDQAAAAAGIVRQSTDHFHTRISAMRRAATSAQTNALIGYLPRLREHALAALARTSRTAQVALGDEVFLRKLFGAVYDCLPKPVARFVTEPLFVEFCLKHRARLLGSSPKPRQEQES
jgi:hypothetical protein